VTRTYWHLYSILHRFMDFCAPDVGIWSIVDSKKHVLRARYRFLV